MAMNLGGNNLPLSEINVVPLVDVMLVLLIIFMIATPHLQHGMEVDLPEATIAPMPLETDDLIITVAKAPADKGYAIFLGNDPNPVFLPDLKTAIAANLAGPHKISVYLRADRNVPYGEVVKVMAEVQKAGVSGLGMITEPEEIRAP